MCDFTSFNGDPRIMRDVVINACYGGFGVGGIIKELIHQFEIDGRKDELTIVTDDGGCSKETIYDWKISRHDPSLVKLVKAAGGEIKSRCAHLKILQAPACCEYKIKEYDGIEWITWDDTALEIYTKCWDAGLRSVDDIEGLSHEARGDLLRSLITSNKF